MRTHLNKNKWQDKINTIFLLDSKVICNAGLAGCGRHVYTLGLTSVEESSSFLARV